MKIIVEKWLTIALVNLCVLALLGITLRYKIAFSLPFIDQRNLLHGHSHFAFSGWVSTALMTLLLYYLQKNKQENYSKRYSLILLANQVCSYGMLLSFLIQGYAFFSILFSTLCIFVSYAFSIVYWKDLNKLNLKRNSHLWFKAALLFNVVSSIGPYSLAFMMSNHLINQKLYLLSIFYFLHFQYNGWFLFVCFGLFISKFYEITGNEKKLNIIFWIFAISSVPLFFVSSLWLPIPTFVYSLVIVSAVMQVIGWGWFITIVGRQVSKLKQEISSAARWLMILAAISMSIKLILQLTSTYMPLNQLVFGFRPIVIGYLHLVFLAIISIFILGYILSEKLFIINKIIIFGAWVFVSGIFINEFLLMIQGVFALTSVSVPYINVLLFAAAIIMFAGVLIIGIKQYLFYITTTKKA
jgi:hypothetical protein